MNKLIEQTLVRLNDAANIVRDGFPTTLWARENTNSTVELVGNGGFVNFVLQPGQYETLRCRLTIPSAVQGVELAGDPLEATLFSLYPTWLAWNGQEVFADPGVPVASGPALFTLLPTLQEGDNGEISFHIKVPNNQMTQWLNLKLTTPRLRERFETLDVLWAQLALANELATGAVERESVESAASLLPNPLPQDTPQLQNLVVQMSGMLAPLSKKAKALSVHLIGHSHIDMNWLWTWPDTREVILRDLKSVLQLMDDYPELTFSHSQPATYEVFRQAEPELFQKILAHIQSGRWEATTMAWIENDVNMSSGEAHARQLLEGVFYSREVLKTSPTSYHAPDTFGHAGNLPQLAASAGATRYYHHRANPGQENQFSAYWWEGDDGTRILCISTYTYNGEIQARDLAQAAIRAHQFGHTCGLHFHGIGDHGGGPSRQNLDALRRFQTLPGMPTALCSRMDAYTKEILDTGVALPERKGESSTIFEGCYTTHADTKYYNRAGENLLCTADTLAVLAGQNHTPVLTEAWRKVLFNQFHDILDGSAIHESYVKNKEDFVEVCTTAEQVIESARKALFIARKVGANQIGVINPLGLPCVEPVCVPEMKGEGSVVLQSDTGHRTIGQYTSQGLAFVASLAAYETARYDILSESSEVASLQAVPSFAPTDNRQVVFLVVQAEEPPYLKVETEHFVVYVRRDSGIFVSFYDKRVGRELVGYGMRRGSDYLDSARADLGLNVLQLVEEHPHGMSSWHYDEVYSDLSLLRGATTRVLETGPSHCILETKHRLRFSTIIQKMIFYRELPWIDFETFVDWQELGGEEKGVPNLKVAFTARMPECEAWFETPFAAVQRPSDGQEVPALRWADVGGSTYGVALINDSKYGYDALGCRLRLTLIRSGYDPDTISDVGQHTIRYRFYPHPGRWQDAQVVSNALAFNQPPITAGGASDLGESAVMVAPLRMPQGSSVQIACLKNAHDGIGVIARFYESVGRASEVRLEVPAGALVYETNVVEDNLKILPVVGVTLRLAFGPWQTRTLRLIW